MSNDIVKSVDTSIKLTRGGYQVELYITDGKVKEAIIWEQVPDENREDGGGYTKLVISIDNEFKIGASLKYLADTLLFAAEVSKKYEE